MAKRQTRRAISVKGLTYQRIKKHCDAEGISVSGFVEDLVTAKLDALGVPQETVLVPRPSSAQRPVREEIVSQHFTF
jgi:hypothetical protein